MELFLYSTHKAAYYFSCFYHFHEAIRELTDGNRRALTQMAVLVIEENKIVKSKYDLRDLVRASITVFEVVEVCDKQPWSPREYIVRHSTQNYNGCVGLPLEIPGLR